MHAAGKRHRLTLGVRKNLSISLVLLKTPHCPFRHITPSDRDQRTRAEAPALPAMIVAALAGLHACSDAQPAAPSVRALSSIPVPPSRCRGDQRARRAGRSQAPSPCSGRIHCLSDGAGLPLGLLNTPSDASGRYSVSGSPRLDGIGMDNRVEERLHAAVCRARHYPVGRHACVALVRLRASP